jgi:4-hydroxybenzoate polyprenyltransferase
VKKLILILRAARPLQWLKNLVIFAPLFFSGLLFDVQNKGVPYFLTALYGFILFCILTSSTYFMNDILDMKADQAHPFKKGRPIASGALSKKLAWVICVTGMVVVVVLSGPLPILFRLLCVIYIGLQILYTKKLKNVAIFDVIAIAAFFLIRIYAGAAVVNIHMNAWFLLTIISASLFLAVGKRQSERTLLMDHNANLGYTRATLKRYSERLLDQYTGMFATATWLTYALFTFQYQFIKTSDTLAMIYPKLPAILLPEKLLMVTVPLAIFGVMRYLQAIYEGRGESPERVLVSDRVLIATSVAMVVLIVLIIYGGVIADWLW